MNLVGKVELREVIHSDLQMILDWRNQKFVRESMFNSDLITMEQHTNWFNAIKMTNGSLIYLFYYNGCPYGFIQFNNIDRINGTCNWSFYIGDKSSPKGMGTLLGVTALNYAYKKIGIRKIIAEVLEYNTISINFHEKLGFTQEGHFKNHILKSGEYTDVIIFGLIDSEWERISREIEL